MNGISSRRVGWSRADDAALDAILALRALWARRAGRATLADLGLDARLQTLLLGGVCAQHERFSVVWTGRVVERYPSAVRCPACGSASEVYVAAAAD